MKTKQLAILALCSLALLLLALLDPWHSPRATPLGRLLAADEIDSLRRIEIVAEPAESIAVERRGDGQWQGVDMQGAPLNPQALRDLVSAMTLLRASRKAARRPAHGISEASAFLKLEFAGGTREFAFGNTSADGSKQWLGARDEGVSYLVETHLVREIFSARERLPSRKLLPSKPAAGQGLTWRGPTGWLKVHAGTQLEWSDREGSPARVSPLRFAEFREGLATLEFTEALAAETSCDQSRPLYELHYAEHSLNIRECGMCGPDSMGLKLGTRTGCVAAEHWLSLTRMIEQPTELLERLLLPTRKAESTFSIRCASKELAITPAKVDAERLQSWWSKIDRGASELTIAPPPPIVCTLEAEGWIVHFGEREGSWFAFQPPSEAGVESILWKLEPELGPLLRAEPSAFLSLHLIAQDPLHAIRIQVAEAGTSLTLVRGELLDDWKDSSGGLDAEAASQWAPKLAQALAGLRAQTFIPEAEQRKPAPRSGRRIEIDFALPSAEQSSQHQLWIRTAKPAKGLGASSCWAQVDTLPPARLSGEDCTVLLGPMP